MVVPFAAGGPTDTIGRVVAEGMRASLGQPIIIENVTGAAGSIGVGRVARAAADGYTISIGQWGSHVTNGAIYALPYDLINDFAPVDDTRWQDAVLTDSLAQLSMENSVCCVSNACP